MLAEVALTIFCNKTIRCQIAQNVLKCNLRWHLQQPANGFDNENHVRQI